MLGEDKLNPNEPPTQTFLSHIRLRHDKHWAKKTLKTEGEQFSGWASICFVEDA